MRAPARTAYLVQAQAEAPALVLPLQLHHSPASMQALARSQAPARPPQLRRRPQLTLLRSRLGAPACHFLPGAETLAT